MHAGKTQQMAGCFVQQKGKSRGKQGKEETAQMQIEVISRTGQSGRDKSAEFFTVEKKARPQVFPGEKHVQKVVDMDRNVRPLQKIAAAVQDDCRKRAQCVCQNAAHNFFSGVLRLPERLEKQAGNPVAGFWGDGVIEALRVFTIPRYADIMETSDV
jgi:hypothetical protein